MVFLTQMQLAEYQLACVVLGIEPQLYTSSFAALTLPFNCSRSQY